MNIPLLPCKHCGEIPVLQETVSEADPVFTSIWLVDICNGPENRYSLKARTVSCPQIVERASALMSLKWNEERGS